MRIPMYWGGMILDRSLDNAYKYENFLKELLERRYEKYSKNWGLILGMQAVYEQKKKTGVYENTFIWHVPDDPLVSINDEACYWTCLRLNHKKINILKLECYKYARRNGHFPVRSNIGGW